MSITYPLSLPTAYSFESLQIGLETSVGRFESPFTYKQQTYDFGGERWMLNVSYAPLSADLARELIAFLASLAGVKGTFYANDPLMKTARGAASGTPLVKGASQTGRSLITDGWTPTVTNILRKGDYFQIGSSLYLNLNDVNSNGSGEATLDISPPLRNTATDNAPLIVSNPKQVFRLDSPATWSTSKELVYDISFSAVEVIP
jgi:hypothetical protein